MVLNKAMLLMMAGGDSAHVKMTIGVGTSPYESDKTMVGYNKSKAFDATGMNFGTIGALNRIPQWGADSTGGATTSYGYLTSLAYCPQLNKTSIRGSRAGGRKVTVKIKDKSYSIMLTNKATAIAGDVLGLGSCQAGDVIEVNFTPPPTEYL